MGKEVGLRNYDERQVCSPMMACPGFAIPANNSSKGAEVFDVPGRREAAGYYAGFGP
jgi:hypothetical protein